jgi:hypothetical protein
MTGDPVADQAIADAARKAGFNKKITPGDVLRAAAITGAGGAMAIPGVLPAVASGALLSAGTSKGETAGQVLSDALLGGGLAYGATKAIPMVGRFLQRMVPAIRGAAETAATRSTFADRNAYRRAFKGSDEARQALGRFMLGEDMPLSSPAAIKESALDIQQEVKPLFGKLTGAADASGQKINLRTAVEAAKASRPISQLNSNSVTRSNYDQIVGMLEDQIAQHGEEISPSTAHDIRMQLDALADWDKSAPKPIQAAWRAARGTIDRYLDTAMAEAGLGEQWETANRRFSLARKLANPKTQRGLADIGAERRAANRFISPYEMIAGAAGATAATMHHPGGLAIPAAVWLGNRYGMPVAATGLEALASGLSRLPSGVGAPSWPAVTLSENMSPEVKALIDALRQRTSVSFVPTAAQEER